jgi:hypothetical protein
MRRIGIALVTAAMLSVAAIGSASAHVHGITPLRCVGVEDDGANRVDDTPGAGAKDGSIFVGLIPPLSFGEGGFDTPACPAP